MSDQRRNTSGREWMGVAIGTAIGVIGWRLLSPDPELTVRILGGATAGALVGIIPYRIGRHVDRRFAIASIVACAVAGGILGLLLAVPVAAILSWLLHRRRRAVADHATTGWSPPPPPPPPPSS